MTRRSDPQWLLLAEKEDIQARATRDLCKWAAVIVFFLLLAYFGYQVGINLTDGAL